MKQKSIVVFGGSFNPSLNSHFSIAQEVLNQYEQVEKIVFIPVNDKYPKKELIENKHRYNMLKLVAEKNNDFIVSDIEISKEKSVPTIDTLEEIQKQYPNKEIWFLMGSDNLTIYLIAEDSLGYIHKREAYSWDHPDTAGRTAEAVKEVLRYGDEIVLDKEGNVLNVNKEEWQ